jgi:hypothetical protein
MITHGFVAAEGQAFNERDCRRRVPEDVVATAATAETYQL